MSSPTYAPTITEEPYSELLWNEDDDDDGAILAMIDEVQQQEELLKKEEETLLNSLMDDKLLYADDDAVFIDDAVEDLVEDFLDESEDYYYDDDDEFNDDDDDFAVPAPTVGPTVPPTRAPTSLPTIPPMPTYFPTVTADPTYFPTVVKEQVDGIPLDTEPDDDDDDDGIDDDEYVPGMPDDDDNYDDDDDLDDEDYYVDDDEEDDDDEFDDDDYASNYGGTTNYAGISALDQAKQTIAEKEQAIEQQIASSSPGQLNGFKDPNTGVVVKEPASLMSQEVKYAAIGGSIAAVLMLLLGCLVYKFCCKQKKGKSVAYEEHNLKDPTINGEDDIHQDGFHDEPAASLGLGHGFTDQVPEPRGMHNVL